MRRSPTLLWEQEGGGSNPPTPTARLEKHPIARRGNQLGSRPQEVEVSTSVLYMSMSLDGYIAGPNDEPSNPGGDGFDRLHEWFVTPEGEFDRPAGPAGELYDEMMEANGAVLAGRRTVEQVDHWGGDHHGLPIFVPSHRP